MQNDLYQSIANLKTPSQCDTFFSRILTPEELTTIVARFKEMRRKTNVRIAIQSKGRLSDPSLDFLSSCGLKFNANGRNCMVTCGNYDIDLLFLRDDDIPRYVERGVADFGIVGRNVVTEENANVTIVKELTFGKCSLLIATPAGSPLKNIQDLNGKRIATSYPTTLRNYLKKTGMTCSIIYLKGSVEIAPRVDLADAICDLVQTGETLEENNLVPLTKILESQGVLIQTKKQTKRPREAVLKLLT